MPKAIATRIRFVSMRCSLYTKSEQHVSGSSNEAAVTGSDVENSVHNNRAWTIHRTAVRLHAIDRIEWPIRIEFPQHRSIFCRVRANASIGRSGENNSGNHSERGRLG